MQETVAKVDTIIQEKVPVQHVVINANKINLMQKDEKLRDIVNSSPLINADGASILLAAKMLGKQLPERVTGIDLMDEVLQLANRKAYRVFFFGATEEVVRKVVMRSSKKYPNVRIVGHENGYFEASQSDEIADDIRASQADIVFVAFSSPMKEYWIHEQLERMGAPFVMGVGGSFDVIAGKTKRAPRWMQKSGLEWFYRFIQEPIRMFERYIGGNLVFLGHILKAKKKAGI
ncbi:glycosyltransferase [Listeria newyorkensis]|uniref:Glycosyltransferase n=2 Tax=Listeria newyorkensis TaxID=1497681 RepID=A0ABX4XJW9_9LIST|nr:WecB/TagA/CpsF family glycosyltransferase [Listeria newyorkensis]PNP89418.1 glycosyltransferase [Listeria newyorkensis]WAO23229.1 WecB/TagA/CpsF family glycosyltransferase [Listeria newyorkensis]